ncbi:MAG: FAD-dependent oxidoreductase [Sphingomonadales bacterium]|nr:FAD-dependent oxidoreductase [Sphingomonadales bacterium]
MPPENWPVNVHRLAIDSEPLYNQPATHIVDMLERCIRISDDPSLFEAVPLPDPDDPARDNGDYRVVGGYDQILKPIASGLDILLSTKVERVAWSGSGVEILAGRASTRARAAS